MIGGSGCPGRRVSVIQAAAWAKKASEQSDPFAEDLLGHLYYIGGGVQKDYAESAKWYLKAAEFCDMTSDKSARYCQSMMHVGHAYLDGDGVPIVV